MTNRTRQRWTPLRLGSWLAAFVCALFIARYLPSSGTEPETEAEAESDVSPASPSMVLPETGVRSGTSATSPDGFFTVHVSRIAGKTVDLTVSTQTQDVYRFRRAEVGRRLVVPAPHGTYYIDLVRVRDKVAYLTISAR